MKIGKDGYGYELDLREENGKYILTRFRKFIGQQDREQELEKSQALELLREVNINAITSFKELYDMYIEYRNQWFLRNYNRYPRTEERW